MYVGNNMMAVMEIVLLCSTESVMVESSVMYDDYDGNMMAVM